MLIIIYILYTFQNVSELSPDLAVVVSYGSAHTKSGAKLLLFLDISK